MNIELNPDQLRRARKALARTDAVHKILDKCANCGIPVDDARAVLTENAAKIEALVREFAPQGTLQQTIQQRERERSGIQQQG